MIKDETGRDLKVLCIVFVSTIKLREKIGKSEESSLTIVHNIWNFPMFQQLRVIVLPPPPKKKKK